jgi:serine/threonine protein kinase
MQLLKRILERDPEKRATVSEILKHPWMTDINTEKVCVFTDQEKERIN